VRAQVTVLRGAFDGVAQRLAALRDRLARADAELDRVASEGASRWS
jgi:argininosuccinate lyase